MKIGVLLPTSRMYPSLMMDFTTGLRTAFAEFHLQNDIEFVFESINQGTEKNQILNSIQKLVLQHQTDVNILFCNYLLLEDIADSINALRKPLIHTNIGGNPPRSFKAGEFIFINSFGLWESAYLAANWGVAKYGKRVAHGSYFYEAGYSLYNSFFKGLEANEGQIVVNQISEFNPHPDDYTNFMNQAEVESPDFLYMMYSERDAVGFLNKLTSGSENGKYPIVTSGVLINDEILEHVSGVPKNIFNIVSWDNSDVTEENIHFLNEYKKQTDVAPNYFSLLGYECAGLISTALSSNLWSRNGNDQAAALKSVDFSSPRGSINFRSELNSTSVEHHVYELTAEGSRKRIETVGTFENKNEYLQSLADEDAVQGWFQPYLCQ